MFELPLCCSRTSLVAQLKKNLPAMHEALVRFLGREDSLEKRQATHSSILGLPWWLSFERICLQCGRPGFDSLGWKDPLEKGKATHSSILAWRIPWTISWGCKELDMTEWLPLSLYCSMYWYFTSFCCRITFRWMDILVLFIIQLRVLWTVSTLGQLGILLLWTFVYKFLYRLFSFSWFSI